MRCNSLVLVTEVTEVHCVPIDVKISENVYTYQQKKVLHQDKHLIKYAERFNICFHEFNDIGTKLEH